MFFILTVFFLYVYAIITTKDLNINFNFFKNLIDRKNDMELYINSKKPNNISDVERLIKDYLMR